MTENVREDRLSNSCASICAFIAEIGSRASGGQRSLVCFDEDSENVEAVATGNAHFVLVLEIADDFGQPPIMRT